VSLAIEFESAHVKALHAGLHLAHGVFKAVRELAKGGARVEVVVVYFFSTTPSR
jgi:hypothetical protein